MIKYNCYFLRKSEPQDAKLLVNWWNNGETMSFFGYPSGMGVTLDDVINEMKNDADIRYNRLIIEVDGKAIGETYYQHLDNQTAKIGIKICHSTLRNKGMGKIILSMLISYLFNELNYKFVTVTTNFKNERAKHVYQKLGFKQVGLETNYENNQFENSPIFVVYKMSKNDFVNFAV